MAMTGTASGSFSVDAQSTRRPVVRAAYRHSRAVRVMRVVLPLTAVLVVGAIIATIVFDPRVLLAAKVDADKVGISGSRIVMERWDKFYKPGKPYADKVIVSIMAEAAARCSFVIT